MTSKSNAEGKAIHLLAALNKLSLKAFNSKTRQSLIFLILNETIQISKYDRAELWLLQDKDKPELLGVSGQSTVGAHHSELSKKLSYIVKNLQNPEKAQILQIDSQDSLNSKNSNYKTTEPDSISIIWIPIFVNNRPMLGLMLERWGYVWHDDDIEILNFLAKGYGAVWSKFDSRINLKQFFTKRNLIIFFTILASLMFIRIPLRVTAPCEVVPKDPILITAPLEGIIEKITVYPGQYVKKGDLLGEYDKHIFLEELSVAENEVKIIKSQLNSSYSESFKDPRLNSELAILPLKLKKEELQLDLAKYRATLLSLKSPEDGVVLLDNPDDWAGRPVKVGEKIMVIADPKKTKVRIWIPESDNIDLNMKRPVIIHLNISPDKSYEAILTYISSYSELNEKSISSFVAEAEWNDKQAASHIKMGLKGTAILYGDNVSLFYWIFRKPWSTLRDLLGRQY